METILRDAWERMLALFGDGWALREDDAVGLLVQVYSEGQQARNVVISSDYENAVKDRVIEEMWRRVKLATSIPKDHRPEAEEYLRQTFEDVLEAGKGEKCLTCLLAEAAGPGEFQTSLRAATYGLWSGKMDLGDFIRSMVSSIMRHLLLAFEQGLKVCGMTLDDLEERERLQGLEFANKQFAHIADFGRWIEAHNKESGGLYRSVTQRQSVWVARWQESFNIGKTLACSDRKVEWVLGMAEHCRSCLKLSGKVKRMSYWRDKGVLPRVAGSLVLACHGFKCQCSLELTDKPMSKGPLPKLP